MSEWVSEWVSEWMNEWISEWVNEWVNEWVSEWMNEWMSEWVSEWMNEWMNEWMSEWVNKWVSEWINEWMSEWMNEWMNVPFRNVSFRWTLLSLRQSHLLSRSRTKKLVMSGNSSTEFLASMSNDRTWSVLDFNIYLNLYIISCNINSSFMYSLSACAWKTVHWKLHRDSKKRVPP